MVICYNFIQFLLQTTRFVKVGYEMEKQEAIDLINTLEVLDYEADGEACYYVNVEDDWLFR